MLGRTLRRETPSGRRSVGRADLGNSLKTTLEGSRLVNTTTADIGAQIAEQRDKIAETVGALAGKFDASDLRALADKLDTEDLRNRAESGASDLLEAASTKDGKKGLVIGAIVTLGLLVLARKLLG